MCSEPEPEVGEIVEVKMRDVARLIGVEAGQVQLETPLNRIKGLVPKVDTIPRSGKKARLYLLTVGEGAITSPRASTLEDLGKYVAVPVAVRRAHEAGRVREGDALVYVPGDEEGERVYHFRVSGDLLEIGERSDPGERKVEVKVEAQKEDEGDRSYDLWLAGKEEHPPWPGPTGREGGDFTPTPRRRRRRGRRGDGEPGET